VLPAQVGLGDLPALARARSDRLRPAQEEKMRPFWPDLALDYRGSAQFLDQQIAKVVALGDGVVPLLLEKLQPPADTPAARHLAANCRRALEQLDPQGFLDALLELLAGSNEIARQEAIRLLGRTDSPRAVQALAAALDQGREDERRILLQALTRLRAAAAAPKIAPMLGSSDRGVREAVLDFLVAARPAAVVPTVLQALSVETDNRLLRQYIEYFAVAAPESDEAARALLPLLDDGRLDFTDTKRLVQVLATVAPRNHDATMRRMHEILDREDTYSMGLEAALTLRSLGDKTGVKKLQAALGEQIKKPQRRREAPLYEQRGDLFMAIEEYGDAIDDYEEVLKHSQSSTQRHWTLIKLARCEAHRKKWSKVLDHLKAAAPTHAELLEQAQKDPALQEALLEPRIRAWVQTLVAEQPGR
jgi:hypothetical protein